MADRAEVVLLSGAELLAAPGVQVTRQVPHHLKEVMVVLGISCRVDRVATLLEPVVVALPLLVLMVVVVTPEKAVTERLRHSLVHQ